jgi:hypothetical protein
MTPEQIEALDNALNAIEFHGSTFKAVYSGTPPNHPIIQLDGDFTVDELRKIVAACNAAMGSVQVVETVTQHIIFHDQGYERRTTKTTPLE